MHAGKLLEDLPTLWEEADLTGRRRLLSSLLGAVYADMAEEKSTMANQPNPAFRPLSEVPSTREASNVVLINEPPLANNEPEAAARSCSVLFYLLMTKVWARLHRYRNIDKEWCHSKFRRNKWNTCWRS